MKSRALLAVFQTVLFLILVIVLTIGFGFYTGVLQW